MPRWICPICNYTKSFNEALAGDLVVDGNPHYISKNGNKNLMKKIKVLRLVKEEITKQVINSIEQLTYDSTDVSKKVLKNSNVSKTK